MTKITFENVSIVIPIAEGEEAHHTLLKDLDGIGAEVFCVAEGGSRSKNMNMGAQKATREYIWFLHADSRVSQRNLETLLSAINKKPEALHYFDLLFDTDGPWPMKVNTWGGNFRSRVFGVPYGDQGFCIAKSKFYQASAYREDLTSAEDLMFVWQARQAGIRLNRVPSGLLTSARKYQQRGWLSLTWLYQCIWIKLSIPEFFKLLKIKLTS